MSARIGIVVLILLILAVISSNLALAISVFLCLIALLANKTVTLLGFFVALAPLGWLEDYLNYTYVGLPFGVVLGSVTTLSLMNDKLRFNDSLNWYLKGFKKWLLWLLFLYVVLEILTKVRYIYLDWDIFGFADLSLLNGFSLTVKEILRLSPLFLVIYWRPLKKDLLVIERYFIAGILVTLLTVPFSHYINMLLSGFFGVIGMNIGDEGRFFGLFALKGDGNTAAICFALSLFYARLVLNNPIFKGFFIISCFIAVVLTGSRTGILLFMVILYISNSGLSSFKSVSALLFAILFYFILNNNYIQLGRINEIDNELNQDRTGSRLYIWFNYLDVWLSSWSSIIFGAKKLPSFERYFFVPHNIWLLLVYNWGLLLGTVLIIKVLPFRHFTSTLFKEYNIDLRFMFICSFLGLFTVADTGSLFFLIVILILLFKRINMYEGTGLVKVVG